MFIVITIVAVLIFNRSQIMHNLFRFGHPDSSTQVMVIALVSAGLAQQFAATLRLWWGRACPFSRPSTVSDQFCFNRPPIP